MPETDLASMFTLASLRILKWPFLWFHPKCSGTDVPEWISYSTADSALRSSRPSAWFSPVRHPSVGDRIQPFINGYTYKNPLHTPKKTT